MTTPRAEATPARTTPAPAPTPPPGLSDPARLQALIETDLDATPDADLDAMAERVRRWLGVPMALVSLVSPEAQLVPGQAGLPDPWARRRRLPLSHSFCCFVVAAAEPLIVVDAREDPLVRDNLAVRDLDVIAYAGMPLTDAEGHVLGALCAIHRVPHQWAEDELELLAGLAETCSARLQLRLARREAEVERERRDQVERDLSASYARSQLLLRASQTFTAATGLADIRRRLADLVGPTLHPGFVAVAVLDEDGEVYRLHDGDPETPAQGVLLTWGRATVPFPEEVLLDVSTDDATLSERFRRWLAGLGVGAALVVRLTGRHGEVGQLVLGWSDDPTLTPADRLFATTIAGYVAQAVSRVRFVEGRVTVAHALQAAMLAPLPEPPGVQIAARYQPADDHEDVGGDWYDASLLPDPADPSSSLLSVSVGDVVGHTLDSAVRMGQVRSMLRQAAWDVAGQPSAALIAVETANAGDRLGLVGTTVIAHLRRSSPSNWSMTWTNAGHPPPVIIAPDGSVRVLDGLDPLFGFPVAVQRPRADHRTEVENGATVFLHTDGLIERPGEDLDEGARRMHEVLERHAGLPVQEVVDRTVAALAPTSDDDVVALAIRLGPEV